jgi:hypothetical protein
MGNFKALAFRWGAVPGVALLLAALALAGPALATPVGVGSVNLSTCDLLSGSPNEELGTGFPPDELITSSDEETDWVACLSTDTAAQNILLTITNQTTRDFANVWYVSDLETSLTNVDGLMNGEEAFRIDSIITDPGGSNLPLVYESATYNDIFEAGETWSFIIDDYFNTLALPASALASEGLVGSGSGGDGISSGSIVVPELGTGLLMGMGLVALSASRRRSRERAA